MLVFIQYLPILQYHTENNEVIVKRFSYWSSPKLKLKLAYLSPFKLTCSSFSPSQGHKPPLCSQQLRQLLHPCYPTRISQTLHVLRSKINPANKPSGNSAMDSWQNQCSRRLEQSSMRVSAGDQKTHLILYYTVRPQVIKLLDWLIVNNGLRCGKVVFVLMQYFLCPLFGVVTD